MMSLATLAIESQRPEDVDAVPAWQFKIWWDDLRAACPDVLGVPLERRRANALNLEHFPMTQRCKLQSPDGRGLAWLLSGGSSLAYGHCTRACCPRLTEATDDHS